jgi:septum formation topological specificity factor MinE
VRDLVNKVEIMRAWNRSQISLNSLRRYLLDVLVAYVAILQSFVDISCKVAQWLNEVMW